LLKPIEIIEAMRVINCARHLISAFIVYKLNTQTPVTSWNECNNRTIL